MRRRRDRLTGGERRGLTLIELMVALFVLGVALLGLAGFSGTVSRQLGGGARQTLAATLVQSRLDSLSSIAPCRSLVANGAVRTGRATTRDVQESWVITDGDNVIVVTDTVRFIGRSQPLVYHSMIVCRN